MAARTVRDLMTDNVEAVAPYTRVDQVYDLMIERSCRHVPVVTSDAELVGLVSERDLLRLSGSFAARTPRDVQEDLEAQRVDEVMHRGVLTVEPDDPIQMAAEILLENQIGCLPVVEGRRLVGIITEADFVRLSARAGGEEAQDEQGEPIAPRPDGVPWT